MRLFKKRDDIQRFIASERLKGRKIGFVPTMGALHQGHISLVQAAAHQCDITVCSIFVNPSQFNDKKDLEKYPRTIAKDLYLLLGADCDVVFYPEVEEMYPHGIEDIPHFNLGNLENILEGKYRPSHFQGVQDIVSRLFQIVRPDRVFFGAKDLQQCRVIEKLMEQSPAFHSIKMEIVPTLREPSRLAMSSRNTRLSPTALKTAPIIYETLAFIKEHIQPGNLQHLLQQAYRKLEGAGLRPDYVAIVRKADLMEISDWDGHTPLSALIAAFLEEVRLIDNLDLGPEVVD